ncbi:DinB family protein [Flavihumibacter cheonanensis]|uniref:DinB family protein n=1 Tax=Flavihumibacter cheonanensis TaxID=1442385 RepID=UPI001EF88953|nr:DinB family protein [Flavihumibacter cheonanensis]MCG7753696.1 DinB family protein [Flavihumibacter cheonanensis]
MPTNNFCQELWNQFGACIDMLTNCIHTVPDDFFSHHKRAYYLSFHTIVFLDYYSSFPPSSFTPLLSFTQLPVEQRPAESIGDMIPDVIYTKEELLQYVEVIRAKCKGLVFSLTGDTTQPRFTEGSEEGDMDYSFLEILLYNLRHTAHHVGQLQLIIRQELNQHTEWSFREGDISCIKK